MSARTVLSSRDIDWFKEQWLADVPIRTICERLHIHGKRANDLARSMGLNPRAPNNKSIPEDEAARIIAMRAEGKLVREIREATGRSYGAISEIAGKRREEYSPEYRNRAIALFRETRSYRAVARALNGPHVRTITDWVEGNVGSKPFTEERPVQVPAEVLRERERRSNIEPRDNTAAFCGDPLPGYSALERKELPKRISLGSCAPGGAGPFRNTFENALAETDSAHD